MSEWISVKDRIPDNETEVLIVLDMNTIDIGFYNYNPTWNQWVSFKYSDDNNQVNVTHWQELPELPKVFV